MAAALQYYSPYSPIAFSSIIVLLLFLPTLIPTAFSQDPTTPGPTIVDCSPRLVALIPCAPFVQGTATVPTQSCCSNLNQLYSLQPGCLCLLLNQTTLSSFPINRDLALQLPFLCKLPANISACSGVPLPSPPGPSGSQVSFGTKQNSTVAASPMVDPAAPRPSNSILGLGFERSNAERLKTEDIFPVVTFTAILLSGQALLY